jgi:large subunit ribosomal protein L3
VLKGTRMAGHMGAAQVTVRNLEVVARNDEKGVIFIGGSVPGPAGGLVRIRVAKKVSK